MNRRTREEWLRDIQARQRNVVFPDTVQNEGRFWRNLWSGKQPLNLAQLIGLLLMFLVVAGSLVFYVRIQWPTYEAPWREKVMSAYGFDMVVFAVVVSLLIFGNRRGRRQKRP